ncbi:hypothetical protein PMAYCL1PPCAC_15261, partial [Pristionchus mayeri]
QQFRCPSGSIFSFLDLEGKFQTRDWWINCEPFEDTERWRVMSGAERGGWYGEVPVGCVCQATCIAAEPYMYVFDGTEQILDEIPQYTLTRNYTSFVEGKLQLACPAGSSIGHLTLDNPPRFSFDPRMKVQCDPDGWMVYVSGSPANPLQPVKIGCFEQ